MTRRSALLIDGLPAQHGHVFRSLPQRSEALLRLASLLADSALGIFDHVEVVVDQHPWVAYDYLRHRLADGIDEYLLVHEVGSAHFCRMGTPHGSRGEAPLPLCDELARSFVDAACRWEHRRVVWVHDSRSGPPPTTYGYDKFPDSPCPLEIIAWPVYKVGGSPGDIPPVTGAVISHLARAVAETDRAVGTAFDLQGAIGDGAGTAFLWSGTAKDPPVRLPSEAHPARPMITVPTRYLGKRVLLVEDNEDNRVVYHTILNMFGYEVLEARNGEDGVRMTREEHPDVVLMDISIPLIDGWEATRILKGDPATAPIPVVALTAHALAEDRARALEVGCDSYLAKPCEPRRVVAEVERFIGTGFVRSIEWLPDDEAAARIAASAR
jgi:CheY-like chemotaxis protein